MPNERTKPCVWLLPPIPIAGFTTNCPWCNWGLPKQNPKSPQHYRERRVTTMSITLEYGVIIFFGLLKILDILTTTALNKLEECQWLLLVFYATDYYLRNQCFTFGVVTTSATSERTKNLDYNATRLKMPSFLWDLIDYKQIPKGLPIVIFNWLLFAPPTTFSVLWSGVAFFRLLGISDYSVFFPTTIFSGLLNFSVFFRLLFFSDYYYILTTETNFRYPE